MAADFIVQFIVNEKTSSRVIKLTDTSSGFTLAQGNFTVTYPDGSKRIKSDFNLTDITSPSGYVNVDALLDSNNELWVGAYKIDYVALNSSGTVYTSYKSFTLDWVKPTKSIVNLSDTMIPEVKFQDSTVYTSSGNFTGVLTSRVFNVAMPTTSAVSGTTITASNGTIDAVVSSNYYEGVYTPKTDIVATYTHGTYSWLTLVYTDLFQKEFAIKKAPTRMELVVKINLFRTQIDAYKETNDTQFQTLNEEYDILMALYSHLIERALMGTLDGSQDILVLILDILYKYTPYTYQSGPISGFYIAPTGTVTSVGLTAPTGFSVSNSPITSAGNLALAFASGYSLPSDTTQATWTAKQNALSGTGFVKINGTTISYDNSSYYLASNPNGYTSNLGTVTSVGLSMPSAFTVANSPVTSAGTLTVTGAGTAAQYIAGDGSLITFPTSIAAASQLTTLGRNSTGSTLYRGTVVYISGSTGNVPNFTKSQASGEATSSRTFGIVKDDIANNSDGYVVTIGSIENLDTRSTATHPFTSDTLVDGDTVYLDPNTAGYITRTKPLAPNHIVYIGKVVRTSPTNGTIVYQIQNGWELGELHNVAAPNGSSTNNDGLFWETSTQLWKNKSIATVLGYTPYSASNPNGYISGITSNNVTTALGYTPYNATNPNGYISGITSSNVTTALGYTPLTAARSLTINGTAYDLTSDRVWSVGTVTSVSALTLGTSGTDLSSTVATGTSTPVITLNVPTASATNRGVLSSADWTTFNNKANALSGTLNTIAKFTSATGIGNSSITDTGSLVTIANPLTLSGSVTGVGNISNYSVTASSGSAISKKITSTLVASANNDTLIGLDINPTFTNGLFTGVSNIALRTGGVSAFKYGASNYLYIGSPSNNYVTISANRDINTGVFPDGTRVHGEINIVTNTIANGGSQIILSTTTTSGQAGNKFVLFGTGNLTLQNGGTFTDNGYRLEVNGTTRFIGTTASDTAPLGSELATVTGTGTNWTLAGTNLNVGGYTHTTGSVVPLTTTLAAVSGTYYQITYTITGRTAGSIDIAYGGTTTSGVTASGNTGPLASSTSALTITPTTDFNGTVVLSIKSIGNSSASSTFANSSGTTALEIRSSDILSNTFIGITSGRRNTTGTSNTFIGVNAGTNNTTGANNTFIGLNAGVVNTTGGANTFSGTSAGQSNTTGFSNTFIGQAAGYSNTTGSSNSFFGLLSGYSNTTGSNNQFIGNASSYFNTLGIENTSVGSAAGYNNTTGSSNIFFGRNAGRYISDGSTSNAITDNSIYIGYNTKALANNQTNQVVIGYNSTGLGSNTTVLGNSSTVTTAIYGNLLLGTTATTGANLTTASSVTASSAIARGVYFNNTLVASANNDVLVGLDINPTFTNGSFTGVTNTALRFAGTGNNIVESLGDLFIRRNGLSGLQILSTNTYLRSASSTGYVNFGIASTEYARLHNSGNFTLQNGGTFTDNGYRLEVNGTTRFIGTTASDTAPLGSELAAVTGSGTNWTLAGTNLNVGGYTHTTGSTTPLTTTLAAVSGTYYQITYTITGRTAGSITIDYGGTSTSVNSTGATGPLASSTSALVITPTTDFNGTVVLSIKSIGTSSASSTFANSTGTSNIELRASSSNTNTFIGLNTGYRNTTGTYNLFFGLNAGSANTSGSYNYFSGASAGQNNVTGGDNIYMGANAGFFNNGSYNIFLGSASAFNLTNSSSNVIIGRNAGRNISGGANATSIDNSVILGNFANPLSNGQSNQIVIGNNSVGLGSNTTVLGNSSTTLTALYGSVITGGTSNDASAQLQVDSTTKGILFPRMTTTQKNAISSPASGLVVYDTTLGKLCVRGATAWETLTSV